MTPIRVMVNGIPGNMAVHVARHVLQDHRFDLMAQSLTGPEITTAESNVESVTIKLIPPDMRVQAMADTLRESLPFISVDFTHPTAVNSNAAFYCDHGLPFVMGTTGGDRKKLEEAVAESSTAAVIAPNMAKQVVGFQAMMDWSAKTFPNLFEGYSLEINESHQKEKADTSGTAKAMIGYFNQMGIPFSETEIKKERDPEIQKRQWQIPEEHLPGHGWHRYTLVSGDSTVKFEFIHNVNGRDVYAGGTLDAIAYLYKKIKQGVQGRVFSMIDVLKGA
jgi:4-hydroxy-tetrahydrodipicolinate reductase